MCSAYSCSSHIACFRRREVEAALAARGIRPGDVASFAQSAQRNAAEQEEADAEKVRLAALQAIAMDVQGSAACVADVTLRASARELVADSDGSSQGSSAGSFNVHEPPTAIVPSTPL